VFTRKKHKKRKKWEPNEFTHLQEQDGRKWKKRKKHQSQNMIPFGWYLQKLKKGVCINYVKSLFLIETNH